MPGVSAYDLGAMRLWMYGGGPLGVEMARKRAASYNGDCFMQVCGMTGSGPQGMVPYPDGALAKAGSIGRCGTRRPRGGAIPTMAG